MVVGYIKRKGVYIMLLFDYGDISIPTKLTEVETNNEASKFVEDKYSELVKYAYSIGITDKAIDLINDVYISLRNSEADGNGYNMNHLQNKLISVEEFVKSRIKKYAQSKRYSSNVVESASYSVSAKMTVKERQLGIDGKPLQDKHGNEIYESKTVTRRTKVVCAVYAATASEKDDENTRAENSINYKYANAVSENDTVELEKIEDALSIDSNIDICIDIASKYDVNIINMLKNIDVIAEMAGKMKMKKEEAIDGLSKIRMIADINDEFKSALEDILTYSVRCSKDFERIIALR